MDVLVVYAHPNPESFNHAVLESFTAGLKDGGHTFEVVDLYAINFNPCMTHQEYYQWMGQPPPQDVLDQQEKLTKADALALVFPIIWMNFPAILHGWIQRVFSSGFAWEVTNEGMAGDLEGRVGLLKQKKALLMSTTHWSKESFETSGIQDAMRTIMCDYDLKFPGIPEVEQVFFYRALTAEDETRKEYLETAYRLGKEF